MENYCKKTITFYNHYGALAFAKKFQDRCKVRSVPRSITSSCGACVVTDENMTLHEITEATTAEYASAVYIPDGNHYNKIFDFSLINRSENQ